MNSFINNSSLSLKRCDMDLNKKEKTNVLGALEIHISTKEKPSMQNDWI